MDGWVHEHMGREVDGYLMDPTSRVPALGHLVAWNTALLCYPQSLERKDIFQVESVLAQDVRTKWQLIQRARSFQSCFISSLMLDCSHLSFLPVLLQIEEHLTLEKLHEWTKAENLDRVEVNVYLPKFKLEESYELNSHLAHLGVQDLFTGRADLSGMSGVRDLFISKIVHKSFVEVNEEGTEAAAATAGIATFAMMMHEENFVADHPFIFFIRHNPSSNILFLGRLCSP